MERPAVDYQVEFRFDTQLNCTSESISRVGVGGAPVSSSSQLTVSVSAPDSVGTNQNFTANASAQGGFTCCGYSYAFDFDAPTENQVIFSTDLGSSAATHAYSQAGTFNIRAVARDGNDTQGHGGNYALSSSETITVVPPRDAAAAGHTLPDTVEALEWVATSVSMTNTGGDTWSGTDYRLKQSRNQVWVPTTVTLDGASVGLNETHTFHFNLKSLEPEELGFQDNFWKMSHVGVLFGEENGQQTYVAAEGSLSSGLLEWVKSLASRMGPRSAFANLPSWFSRAQEDVVQELRIEDQPIPTALLQTEGEFRLRYSASLDKPWDVDFRFRIVFDDSALRIGQIIQGVRSAGYRVQVETIRPGEVVIQATRDATTGLNGHGRILEIPIVLKPNSSAPETLKLVEIVAFR